MQDLVFLYCHDSYLQDKESSSFGKVPPLQWGFTGVSVVKNLPANVGDTCSIPGLGRSPGEGNGKSLQYSYLENHMDRGALQATVRGVAKSQTQLSS